MIAVGGIAPYVAIVAAVVAWTGLCAWVFTRFVEPDWQSGATLIAHQPSDPEMSCPICGWEPTPVGVGHFYTRGSQEFHERMRTHYACHQATAAQPEAPAS